MLKFNSKIKRKFSASHLIIGLTYWLIHILRVNVDIQIILCVLLRVALSIRFYFFMEVKAINKDLLVNEEIREREVRLIDSDGEQLGIIPTKKAIDLAESKQLDLVMISPQGKPPVCKIMDYSKHIYEITKREKEARKNQKVINVKEIRFSPNIEEHDLNVKAKNAEKFLNDGDKVKVTVRFRGREADYSSQGQKLLSQFAEKLKDSGDIEKPAKLEGRNMIMILKPKKDKK